MNTRPISAQYLAPAIAALTPLVFLLPFANKAYHIDDTFYLWVAEKIHETPLDYYGFDIAWGPTIRPAFEVNKNPPGVSYLWAGVATVFGWGEIPMHLAAALIASLFSLGVYYLARRFTQLPLLAVFLAIIGPGFMVSANTVMSDVPMMAAYVWAILLWIKGLENDAPREGERTREPRANQFAHLQLITAAILIAVATLTKYFGITALPLLLVYTLLRQRRFDPRLAYLLIPIVLIALYQWHSANLYGENLLGSAAGYAVGFSMDASEVPRLFKTGVALAFLGGSFAALLFYAPLLWRWPVVAAGVALITIITAYLLTFDQLDRLVIRTDDHLNWGFPFQIALWSVAGIAIVALAVQDLIRHRDADAILLFLWFAGTFLFSAYLNWAINVRTILPLAPALGIIAARRLELRFPAERLKQIRFHA
ncbi:MAG: glycosyltransferase family 39 protein, partial [Candidatus Hydrogenedentales bacterium]